MNLYYCYLLIQSYWTPIVGAVLASVALRGLKRTIATDIRIVTAETSGIFWKTIPMMYWERLKKYWADLRVAMKKRFWPGDASRSSEIDQIKLGKRSKRKKRHELQNSLPAISREALLKAASVAPPPAAPKQLVPRKRVRTFPFLAVLFGIVLASALSLPLVVYLALGLLLATILFCHVVLYLTGLNVNFSKFVHRNSDAIATLATIVLLLGSGFMLGAFFLVNCSLEATRAATDLYRVVDGQVFSNPEYQEYVKSLGLQAEAKQATDQMFEWYREKRLSLEATALGRIISAFNFAEWNSTDASWNSTEGSVTKRFATHLMIAYSNVSVHDVETMIQSVGFTGFKIYDLQCVNKPFGKPKDVG